MSIHNEYLFRTRQRNLSEEQQTELREYSNRATITSTSFHNYGELSADPHDLLSRYFDLYFHKTSQHCKFGFRIEDAQHIDRDWARRYHDPYDLDVKRRDDRATIIFSTRCETWPESNDWLWFRDWLTQLEGNLDLVASGDMRPIYLGWFAQLGQRLGRFTIEDPHDLANLPPLPADLGELNDSLRALADFCCLDLDALPAPAYLLDEDSSLHPSASETWRNVRRLLELSPPQYELTVGLLHEICDRESFHAELLALLDDYAQDGELLDILTEAWLIPEP